jgi:hypothetical protein
MDYSSVFKPAVVKNDLAGKYSGLFGFSPDISLGENLVTPLNQQPSGMGMPSGSSLDDIVGDALRRSFDPNYQKETLKNKLAYDKEQMKQAFPYLMAREIPRQISEAYSNQAAMTVLGARSAVDAMNETLRARPPMSFASVPYQYQKYFS